METQLIVLVLTIVTVNGGLLEGILNGAHNAAESFLGGLAQGGVNIGFNAQAHGNHRRPTHTGQQKPGEPEETIIVVVEEQPNSERPGNGGDGQHHHNGYKPHHHHKPGHNHNHYGYGNGNGYGNQNPNWPNQGNGYYGNPSNPNWRPNNQNPYQVNPNGQYGNGNNYGKPNYGNPNYGNPNNGNPNYGNPNNNGNPNSYGNPNNYGNSGGQNGNGNPNSNGNQNPPSYSTENPKQDKPEQKPIEEVTKPPGGTNYGLSTQKPVDDAQNQNGVYDDKVESTTKGTGAKDRPLYVPLNPNQYIYGGDKIEVNAPKRETDNSKPKPADDDDEEFPIDIRIGDE